MRKLILVAHISLDGFAAGAKGELDGFPKGEENLAFVCQLTDTADTALFGTKAFSIGQKNNVPPVSLPDDKKIPQALTKMRCGCYTKTKNTF